ncbi:MAG: MurR/RpiR family transcriptional regulator [Clostridia bacterium]|nr:MurR/RpiR family transcriptional regulator [Clostridia bacterium]
MDVKSNLLMRIAAHQSKFSKGQRAIAHYLADHYEEAAYMTAFQLGETVGVSESTVVRFAAEIGFEGYPELQKAVRELVRSRLTTLKRIELTRARMTDDEVFESVMQSDINNVRQTLDSLPREVFDAAVNDIVSARRVYVFGAGSCRALANFLNYYLKLLMSNVHLIYTSSSAEIFEEMIDVDEDDVVIGISFPRYSSKAVMALDFAHSRNAKVIAITDSQLSPISDYADHLLLAHSDLATVVDSLVAPLSIINALIVAISLKKLDEKRETLETLEDIWTRYEVYQALPDVPHEDDHA